MAWRMDHIQIIFALLQTDNHSGIIPVNFYRPHALPGAQPTVSEHWRHSDLFVRKLLSKSHHTSNVLLQYLAKYLTYFTVACGLVFGTTLFIGVGILWHCCQGDHSPRHCEILKTYSLTASLPPMLWLLVSCMYYSHVSAYSTKMFALFN